MNALVYLVKANIKNLVRQAQKKPGLVIAYAAIASLVIFSLSANRSARPDISPQIWQALLLVYLAAQFYVMMRGALTNGTTVFGMDDVQLMFCAPVRPQAVLLYGTVRQMGKSLLIPFFLLTQTGNLHNLLGMMGGEIVALFFAMFIGIFVSQTITMCVYALLAQNDRAKKRVMLALNVCAVAFVAAGVASLGGGKGIDGILGFYSNAAWDYAPLIGWLRAAVVFAARGETLTCALLCAASALVAAIPLLVVYKRQPDFYEDVLDISQHKHELKLLAQSGNKGERYAYLKKVRVKAVGLSRGKGASTFFMKHLVEQRRMGMLFLDMWTLIDVVLIAGMCYFLGRNGAGGISTVYLSLGILVYVQMVFFVSTGHFVNERKRPFLYLTPNSPRMKLVMCNLLSALKAALDALLCFLAAGLISGFSLLHAPFAAMLCGSLTLLFTASLLISDWLVGDRHSKLLGTALFFLIDVVLMIPALVLFILGTGMNFVPASYLLAAAYAFATSFLLYGLLGGMLHNANVE